MHYYLNDNVMIHSFPGLIQKDSQLIKYLWQHIQCNIQDKL